MRDVASLDVISLDEEPTMGSAGDKAKGKANEVIGKVTGKRSKQVKGKGQQAKGEFKDEVEEERERSEGGQEPER